MDKHKTVELGGAVYRIDQMSADVGSWVVIQLLTKMLPTIVQSRVSIAGKLPSTTTAMTRAEFAELQGLCLSVVRVKDEKANTFVPIIANGKWIDKSLEFNLPNVLALTVHALEFNMSDFFQGGGSSALSSFSGLFSSIRRPSTDSSTDPSSQDSGATAT